MKKLFFLTLIFSRSIFSAESYMIYLGGGGEPKDAPNTIFDKDMKIVADIVSQKKLKKENVDIIFNGGHVGTEEILKNRFAGVNVKNLNRQTYKDTILKYRELILSGKIKAGDKLLITIDTHGAPKSANEQTHQLATGNSRDGSENISADVLQSISDLANEKGIKLAIADLSCFSGNTQNLKGKNTCLISATGPKHYGYKSSEGFSIDFLNGIKSGKNFEDSFLEARKNGKDRDYPMINTEENDLIYSKLYPGISPYLYYKSNSGIGTNTIDYYMVGELNNELFCKNQKSFNEMLKFIDDNEKLLKFLSTGLYKYQYNYTKLKNILSKAKNNYDGIFKEYLSYKEKLKSKVEIRFKNNQGSTSSKLYSMEEVLFTDYKSLLKKESENPNGSNILKNLYSSLITKQDELKRNNPNLVTIQAKGLELGKRIKNSLDTSYYVATEEKRLYNEVYRLRQKANPRKTNPCREFSF